jgi:hypothetical protein
MKILAVLVPVFTTIGSEPFARANSFPILNRSRFI